jgi:glycosyltransferase involved in cell wall biosynthesis
MKIPKVVMVQIGSRQHYVVPVTLHKFNLLEHFYTSAYTGKGSWLNRFTPILSIFKSKDIQKLLGRKEDGLPSDRVTAFNMRDVYNYFRKIKAKSIEEIFHLDIIAAKKMAHNLRKKNALKSADIVYSFTMEAKEVFEYAKELGVLCVLEQIHPSYRVVLDIVKREFEIWEGWEKTDIVAYDKYKPLLEREMEEFLLSDLIIAESQFTADGLKTVGIKKPQNYVIQKCKVMHYGSKLFKFNSESERKSRKDIPINLLFVGRVDLRKGVPYLLEALRKLPEGLVKTKIVGTVAIYKEKLNVFNQYCEIVGPVPRTELAKIYKWADIFVFPTVLEGSATVVFEALAHGLPVITTLNSGSVVRDGTDGFIVPIRDSEAIAKKIELLATDHELREWMSRNARKRAEEYNLSNYGRRLFELLIKFYNQA